MNGPTFSENHRKREKSHQPYQDIQALKRHIIILVGLGCAALAATIVLLR